MIKLYSPCGKCSVSCHPASLENMKASGWTEEEPIKTKPAKAVTKEKEVK